jgi:hypothetical protein
VKLQDYERQYNVLKRKLMKRKHEEVDIAHEGIVNRPFFPGLAIQVVGVLLGVLFNLRELGSLIWGFGCIVMASSGYWQVKHRFVPGFPALRGWCAIAFGIFFILIVGGIGLGLIFFVIFPEG